MSSVDRGCLAHEGVADEQVVGELAAAAEPAGEALVFGDGRG